MPRKDFVADLKKAQNEEGFPPNVVSISPGQDDGSILLLFRLPPAPHDLRLHMQISDVGDYPRSHSFFVFSESEDVSENFALALSKIPLLEGLSVSQTVAKISAVLNRADDQTTQDDVDSTTGLLDSDDDDDNDPPFQDEEQDNPFHPHNSHKKNKEATPDQVRRDLSVLKEAGFRVSHDGAILEQHAPCSLTVSIRVSKLGIPENALEAWHLQPSEYVMLLLKYRRGYRGLEGLHSFAASTGDIEMFVLVTKHHKLTASEISYSTKRTKKNQNVSEVSEKVSDDSQSVRPLFIGSALEELLNIRLLALVQHRLDLGLNWDGAMTYYNDMQGVFRIEAAATAKYYAEQDASKVDSLPPLLRADHIRESPDQNPGALSLPCIAMQFTLRHIVRCTEFCLVCFDRTNDSFEALKPYVCSKPLCLFQYMSMGFGPGIEFEILSQKYVVDLLISFCYAATLNCSLTTLPVGLGLMVPDPELVFASGNYVTSSALPQSLPELGSANASIQQHKNMLFGQWNSKTCEIVLPKPSEVAPKNSGEEKTLKVGEWIAFWGSDQCLRHCQITDTHGTTYHYASMILSNVTTDSTTELPGAEKQNPKVLSSSDTEPMRIAIVPYRKLFDSIDAKAQHVAIRIMLDTLPNVEEMATHLNSTHGSMQDKLGAWKERMIPSALGILRWIIASNRSCIIQETDSKKLVHGMPGYFQLRFASGAPDKESRFINCVNQVSARLKATYPTIFAWHGSPLQNWHSIIREGLNFKRVVHGRAYGNGVYHALQAQVSISYTAAHLPNQNWPSSKLSIQSALSLNEIVNAPAEFQSRQPYLVVQHEDWIQTRYLFVKCCNSSMIQLSDQPPTTHIMAQDSIYRPIGVNSAPLLIPNHSKDLSRGNKLTSSLQNAQILASPGSVDGHEIELSDESDADDVLLYAKAYGLSKHNEGKSTSWSVTSFKPGSLNRSTLPILASPTYATPLSSRILQRELQLLFREQQETPLSELGWYIDPDHVDNTYHWIVELHSFDLNLPLAKDMQDQGIDSIIIEIRFGPNFNFSPPFIRIVRPRFVEFAMGGGGHVTAGGALCMQLLTSDGWNPSSTMSAVLLQIRMAITSTDPRPAKLARASRSNEYSPYEAAEAYRRACNAHGWKVPEDLSSIIAMSAPIGSSLSAVIPQKRPAATP